MYDQMIRNAWIMAGGLLALAVAAGLALALLLVPNREILQLMLLFTAMGGGLVLIAFLRFRTVELVRDALKAVGVKL